MAPCWKEFAAEARSLFDQLDRNGDGTLTREELNPQAQRSKGDDGTDDSGHGRHRGGGGN